MKVHATSLSLFVGFAIIATACTSRGEGPPPVAPTGRVRPALHAGSWYPAEPTVLRRAIEKRRERRYSPSTMISTLRKSSGWLSACSEM